MATLITYVRGLIGDPSPAPSGCSLNFTDDEIQQVLDQHRTDTFQRRLVEADDLNSDGVTEWRAFYAQIPFWESSPRIQANTWDTIVPTTSDDLQGLWTFATSQSLPLWLSGSYYDVYAAACDLLRRWMAKVKLDFDFSSVNSAYRRSQKIRAIADLIRQYQQRQPLRRIKLPRYDSVNTGRGW